MLFSAAQQPCSRCDARRSSNKIECNTYALSSVTQRVRCSRCSRCIDKMYKNKLCTRNGNMHCTPSNNRTHIDNDDDGDGGGGGSGTGDTTKWKQIFIFSIVVRLLLVLVPRIIWTFFFLFSHPHSASQHNELLLLDTPFHLGRGVRDSSASRFLI